MFFGRARLIAELKVRFEDGIRLILVEGARQSGKTSILRQLRAPGHGFGPDWICVEASFQGTVGDAERDGISTEGVFRLLVRDIGLACARAGSPVLLPDMEPVPDPIAFPFRFARALTGFFEGNDPYEALQSYIDAVIDEIQPRRLLLMLDEFDKVHLGIENNVTTPAVLANLKDLLKPRPQLAALLAGSRRLGRLRDECWSEFLDFGDRVGLDPLGRDEVDALVKAPVADFLEFEPAALDQIAHLTGCQPYLVQSLCSRIFEALKVTGSCTVSAQNVDQCAAQMVVDNDHFRALWDYAETDRRRYILWLVHESQDDEGTSVGSDQLAARLAERGIRATTDDVDEDLRCLWELEIVNLEQDRTRLGACGCSVPLMRRWMTRNIDPEAQRKSAARETRGRSEREWLA